MRLTHHCEPAQPGATNLDAVETGASWVVVADGVTPKTETSSCKHGTHWYTTTLVSTLARRLNAEPDEALPDLVRAAITLVADAHADTCDLDHPDHPSAMLAVVRERGEDLDYLVIGDVLVLLEVDGAVRSITDGRPDALPHFDPDFVSAQRNNPGGFVVAGARPDVVACAMYGSVRRKRVTRGAVMSDGGARLADRFGQLDHAQLLDLVEFAGPARVVERIRDAERDETAAELRRRRGKTHDDATVVMVQLVELYATGAPQLADHAATLLGRLPAAVDLEVWSGMVAMLARVHHARAECGDPPGAGNQHRRIAFLLTLLARGAHAGVRGRSDLTAQTWADLAGIPADLEQQYSAQVTALSVPQPCATQGRIVREFAAQVRRDQVDAAVGAIFTQVADTYVASVRQPAHGRRPVSAGHERLLMQIARQRAQCTGEHPDLIARQLDEFVRGLAGDQCAAVAASLTRPYDLRLLGDATPVVDEATRARVLPAAGTPAQQCLEAQVLLALGRALASRRKATVSVVPQAYLGADGELDLIFGRTVGDALVRELCRRRADGQLAAIPELRVRAVPRGLVVSLAEDEGTQVRLRGIGKDAVGKAVAALAGNDEMSVPAASGPDHHGGPAAEVDGGLQARLSDLLRRIGLLGPATGMTATVSSADLVLSWSGGRSVPAVARELVHPLTGLPGDAFDVTRSPSPDAGDAISVRAANTPWGITLHSRVHTRLGRTAKTARAG